MNRRVIILLLIPLLVVIVPAAVAFGILRVANINILPVIESMAAENELFGYLALYYNVLRLPLQLIFIAVIFFLAYLLSRLTRRVAGWLLRFSRFGPLGGRDPHTFAADPDFDERRFRTIQELAAGVLNLTLFVLAGMLAFSQFFSLANLAIIATVTANAFGFAARDYIGDLLNGISNIFEDRFNVGDNVAILRMGDKVEGVVEQVTVRTLRLRTRGGELINVPQGEVRVLRNYSRGSFSGIDVIVRIAAADLPRAMAELQALGEEAPALLPDLLQPWTLVSRDGTMGSAAEIRIHARARYAYGAGIRLRIMILVEERLSAAGVSLA